MVAICWTQFPVGVAMWASPTRLGPTHIKPAQRGLARPAKHSTWPAGRPVFF